MQSIFQYNQQQRRWYNDYLKDVKELTNRQLLKEERQERQRIADIAECEARQQGKERQYYLGDDLPSVKKWTIKNHAVTVAEIEARGYVWKNDKYVKSK